MQKPVEARKDSGSPAGYKGKPPRAPLSPLKGFLILLGVLVLALFLSLVASVLTVALGIMGPSGAFIIPMLFLGAIVPFLLGLLVRNWGWTIGLSYTLLYLFLVLPWYLWGEWGNSYMWISAGRKHAPYYWIPLTLAVCLLFSLLGSYAFGKRRGIRLNLEKPAYPLVPVVALSVFLSVLAPFAMDFFMVERAKISRYPQYNFQIMKPKGWHALESLSVSSSDDMVRKEAEAEIDMQSSSGTPNGGQVWIYVYSKMPFTGVPLESFKSSEEVYENLLAVLEDVKRNPTKYMESYLDLMLPGADLAYYGHTRLDGVDAIRLNFTEYKIETRNYKPHAPLPSSSPYGDIIVYREPYLYWLEMGVEGELYNKIKDSFKFLE